MVYVLNYYPLNSYQLAPWLSGIVLKISRWQIRSLSIFLLLSLALITGHFLHCVSVILVLIVVFRAVDGKVRIWNMGIGTCLRIFRGNSQCHPITQIRVWYSLVLALNSFLFIHPFIIHALFIFYIIRTGNVVLINSLTFWQVVSDRSKSMQMTSYFMNFLNLYLNFRLS